MTDFWIGATNNQATNDAWTLIFIDRNSYTVDDNTGAITELDFTDDSACMVLMDKGTTNQMAGIGIASATDKDDPTTLDWEYGIYATDGGLYAVSGGVATEYANWGTGATTLDELTDVVIDVTIANNEVLSYDTVTSKWINQTAAEASLAVSGHGHTASDVSDFDTEVGNHTDVTANTTHRGTTTGNPHSINATDITDFDTEVGNHTDVTANTTHRSSDGKNHADVVLNNTHRNTTTGNPHSINYTDAGAEQAFSKNTAFNKNFGTLVTEVAYGNHVHSSFAGNFYFSNSVDVSQKLHFKLDAANMAYIYFKDDTGPDWETLVIGRDSATAPSIQIHDTITVRGGTTFANDVDITGNLDVTDGFNSHITPTVDSTTNLGDVTHRFNDLFMDGKIHDGATYSYKPFEEAAVGNSHKIVCTPIGPTNSTAYGDYYFSATSACVTNIGADDFIMAYIVPIPCNKGADLELQLFDFLVGVVDADSSNYWSRVYVYGHSGITHTELFSNTTLGNYVLKQYSLRSDVAFTTIDVGAYEFITIRLDFIVSTANNLDVKPPICQFYYK